MFGYVKVDRPECRLREYEYYRAVYCGLCKSLGKCTGAGSRWLLSYDMTFMVLVRLALAGKTPPMKKSGCIAHPFRRRLMASPPRGSEEERIFALCACATTLLFYHKLRDDIADERGIRRFSARLLQPVAKVYRRRARKKLWALDDMVQERLLALSTLEKSDHTSVDAPAELFGALLAELLSFELDGSRAALARTIGKHIGKWIYLVDAIDDLEDDVKKGRYNPLSKAYGGHLDETAREGLSVALTAELMEAERAFDLLDYPDENLRGVVENIIYSGMTQTAHRVLWPCAKKGKCND